MYRPYALKKIPGIMDFEIQRLKENKIKNTLALLEAAKDFKGRQKLAPVTGISPGRLIGFANACDMFRLHGMGTVYVQLLNSINIQTTRDLKHRNPYNVYVELRRKARTTNTCIFPPHSNQVRLWVERANRLDIVISY